MDVEEGTATPERRRPFLAPVLAAGVAPRLTVRPLAPGPGLPRLETTAWRARDGRILAFVLQKARVASGAEAEGPHLAERRLPIEVRLAAPVTGVVDERTGGKLPDGDRFRFTLDTTEAVFFSFAGAQGTPGGRR